MKFLAALFPLFFSSVAYSQICTAQLMDNSARPARILRTFQESNCMRECNKYHTLSLGDDPRYKCMSGQIVTQPQQPRPQQPRPQQPRPQQPRPQQPQPQQPWPEQPQNPYPQPYPQQGQNTEVRRYLNQGESVYHANKSYTVIGISYSGLVSLRDSYGYITHNIPREEVAVSNGCSFDVCVQQSVIDLNARNSKTVVGLRFNGGFVLKDSYGYLSSINDRSGIAVKSGCLQDVCVNEPVIDVSVNASRTLLAIGLNSVVLKDSMGYISIVDESKLAVLKGCSYYREVCVGNHVMKTDSYSNQYFTVIAIQRDGRVVIKDGMGYLSSNIEPSRLLVTR